MNQMSRIPRTLYFYVLLSYLEEPGEDVKLKDRDVVIAGEVDGGLQGHGFQTWADRVKLVESLAKGPPWHYGPAREEGSQKVTSLVGT